MPAARLTRTNDIQIPSGPSELPPGTIMAIWDWGSGTGTSDFATGDQSRDRPLDYVFGIGSGLNEVFNTSSAGRDYPSTNFLRIGDGWIVLAAGPLNGETYIPELAVGDSQFWRFYCRWIASAAASEDSHGNYFDDAIGGVDWGPNILGLYLQAGAVGSTTVGVAISAGDDVGQERYFWPGFALQKTSTYRWEIRVTRTSTTTYTLAARVYDINDTLLADIDEWPVLPGWGFGDNMHLREFTTTAGRFSSLRGIELGLESNQGGGDYNEFACMIITQSSDPNDWPGPYSAAEASWTP